MLALALAPPPSAGGPPPPRTPALSPSFAFPTALLTALVPPSPFASFCSRSCYETPGGTVLRAAHMDIEGVVLDREVRRLRDMLAVRFSEIIYNGLFALLPFRFPLASFQAPLSPRAAVRLHAGPQGSGSAPSRSSSWPAFARASRVSTAAWSSS